MNQEGKEVGELKKAREWCRNKDSKRKEEEGKGENLGVVNEAGE